MRMFISHVICVGSHVERTATIEVFGFYSDSFGAEHCDSFAFTGIQSNDFPNNFLRASGTLFLQRGRGCRSVRPRARSLDGTLRGSPVFKVARRAGR